MTDTQKSNLRKEPLPLDRGWAWVICFGVFSVAFLTITGAQVNAIGFLDMVKELETSVTTLSISVTVQLFASSISALMSVNVLVPYFGQRPVIGVTGFLTAISTMVMSMAPSVQVYILLCFFKGAAAGCYFVPCIALVGQYFRKRRSIATTVSICGTSVAAIGPPALIRIFVDNFGIRNAYLMLGALELHLIAIAMLLRPVSSYGPPLPDEPEVKDTGDAPKKPEAEMKLMDGQLNGSHSQDPLESPPSKPKTVSFDAVTEQSSPPSCGILEEIDDNDILLETKNEVLSSNHGGSKSPVSISLERPGFFRSLSTISSSSLAKKRRPPLERGQSVWSMMSGGDNSLAGPAVNVDIEVAEEDTEKSSPLEEKKKQKSCSKLSDIFDLSLFSNWRFLALIFGDLLASSNFYLLAYFPTLVVVQGVTKDQAATLQTIMGAVDLVGRLTVGIIADFNYFRPSQVSGTSIVCLAVMCHMCPLFSTFQSMIGMVVGLGFFVGVRQSLSPVVHIEVMGIARMGKSYSFSMLVIAGGAASYSAFLSAILEDTESTTFVWHYVGSALLIYGTLLLCLPLVHRLEMKVKGQTPPAEESRA